MALRVARGLFRLWLVLSVLWISGVGVVTWQTFPVADWVAVPPSPGELQSIEDANAAIQRAAIENAVQSAVVLALVPPAFLLALGSALIWAIRGFR